ncbi:choice-of-anchor D domain-containing protein, partial [Verrucomicrobiota bacterium]
MGRYIRKCLCFAFLFVSVFVCSQQAAAQTYTLTVIDGTGSGTYSEGQIISCSRASSFGKVWEGWTASVEGVIQGDPDDDWVDILMPAQDVTVTANFSDFVYIFTYEAQIGGRILGETFQTPLFYGETTTVVTAEADAGYTFDRWSDGKTSTTRTDVALRWSENYKAYFLDDTPGLYTLTVINGSGSGEYTPSSAVPIMATAVIPGKTFHYWTTSGSGSFSNAYDANTIFTIHDEDATVTAHYVPAGEALNILVIGNSRAYRLNQENAFSPVNIGAELRSVLTNDPAVNTQMINVVVDDYYDTEFLTTDYREGYAYCYTLAQYYFWPPDRTNRLANLRGELGTPWDYVVMMDDSWNLARNPGINAEGVNLIADEVRKGTNNAEPILLMQWPDSSSPFSVSHLREISHRVGDGAGIRVVPAGYAWDTWGSKDTSANHPTPHGAYLAAASIYSEIYNRSATNSTYSYSNAIADHAWTKVQEERTNTIYTGNFAYVSPICYDTNYSRHIDFSHTGTSTESGMQQRLAFCMGNMNITYTRWLDQTTFPPELDIPIDFNYGRHNYDKAYDPDPVNHRRAIGYGWFNKSDRFGYEMRHCIDRHSSDRTEAMVTEGFMVSRVIDRNELPLGARVQPDRLMWCKLYDVDNNYIMNDGHRLYYYAITSSSYMLAAISGRCPMADEPFFVGSGAWNLWAGAKVGYETAVRMCSLKGRASGFQVMPERVMYNRTFFDPENDRQVAPESIVHGHLRLAFDVEEMTVKFHMAPTSDVTVNVSVDVPGTVSFSTSTNLLFTSVNYYDRQDVTFEGLPGVNYYEPFNVVFRTTSDDDAYDGLYDQWEYTLVRTPRISVLGNGDVVTNGDNTASGYDYTDFGSAEVSGGTVTRVFTISNSVLAQADLALTGTPVVAVSAGASDFTVISQPSSTNIAPGSSVTFEVEFNPTAEGIIAGEISIANNDYDESSYTIAIQGQGVSIPPVVDNDLGVEKIVDEYVTVQGTLTSGLFSDIYIYWGTNDGGEVASAWENTTVVYSVDDGDFSLQLSGLDFETPYYYRVFASNALGTAWATSSVSFVSDEPIQIVDDFVVHRGVFTQAVGEVTTTLINGVDYNLDPSADKSRAFIRVVSSHLFGGGNTTRSDDVSGEFAVSIKNPDNLLASVTFARNSGDEVDFVVFWELIEYVGPAGGPNEIIVRDQTETGGLKEGPLTITGNVVNAISDVDRTVVFVTGQRNTMFTADINESKQPLFTKGARKTDSRVSYAVVEFTGSNWKNIQRIEHAKESTVSQNYEDVVEVPFSVDLSKTFMHLQNRSDSAGLGTLETHTLGVWLSAANKLTFRAMGDGHGSAIENTVAVAWLIENTGSYHPDMDMKVQHIFSERRATVGGISAADVGPVEWTESLDTIRSLSNASIMGETARTDTHYSRVTDKFGGRVSIRLSGTNEVTLWMPQREIETTCWFDVVDWPRSSVDPDMLVVGGDGIEIMNNDLVPDISDGTYFGEGMMLYQSRTRTFAISNRASASAELLLSGSPLVTISGVNPEDFHVSAQPAATNIPVGGSTTFDIVFNPQTDGYRSALVTIFESNDPAEPSYSFAVSGRTPSINDFRVHRGTSIIPAGETRTKIVHNVDYALDLDTSLSNAFVRMVNTSLTGGGGTNSQTTARHFACIENSENLMSYINFQRADGTPPDETHITWEIIEYTGEAGGPNEMIVRDQAKLSFDSNIPAVTGAVVNAISDTNRVVVFLTGKTLNLWGNKRDSAGKWIADLNTSFTTNDPPEPLHAPVFERPGGSEGSLSYAVVEFTGSNWRDVQRVEHTIAVANSNETETITAVDLARTFMHVQFCVIGGNIQGVEAWLSSPTEVTFHQNSRTNQIVAAWIVENTDTDPVYGMKVQHISGNRGQGPDFDSWTETISPVEEILDASIMGECADSGGTTKLNLELTDTNEVTLTRYYRADSYYRFSVVDWPKKALPAQPYITVLGNGLEILTGDNDPVSADGTDFGDFMTFPSFATNTYSITNTGNEDLVLTGSPVVTVSGDGEFSLVMDAAETNLAAWTGTEFSILFNPTVPGVRTAQVSIANNDTNRNPYTFSIKGSGVEMPVIDAAAGATNISRTTVTLQGNLTAGVSADVYIYWGEHNWGENASQWANTNVLYSLGEGDFSIDLTGLTGGKTYFYTIFATNNAGSAWSSPSSSFTMLPATRDFVVHRGTFTMPAGTSMVTLYNTNDYTLSEDTTVSNVFIKLVNACHGGSGDTNGFSADSSMAWIGNPGNILTSVDINRKSSDYSTFVSWEILEYIGNPGGVNEIIVRDQASISIDSSTNVVTGAAAGSISDTNRVIVYVTGQAGSDGYVFKCSFASELDASKQPVFKREAASGNSSISYAVVEFTGSNWRDVQRIEHVIAESNTEEKKTISGVALSRAFMHVQVKGGSGTSQYGAQVWFSAADEVTFFDPYSSGRSIAAWIVENQETDPLMAMKVQHIKNDRYADGPEPETWTEPISAVADMDNTSIMGENCKESLSWSRSLTTFELTAPDRVSMYRAATREVAYYAFSVVEWPMGLRLSGSGAEIGVWGSGSEIVNGDNIPSLVDDTDFGNVVGGSGVSHVFTVTNSGTNVLNLTGNPVVQLSGHTNDFKVTSQPGSTIGVGSSATFTIEFDPTASGIKTVFVSIDNDDFNENPYSFTVQGMGFAVEMAVMGDGQKIMDGDNTPDAGDGTEYGNTWTGMTNDQVFVITNSGVLDLNLTGTTAVVINGDPEFSVLSQPSGPIVPGGSESFTVRFMPTVAGLRTGELFIANNDTDDNPYTFTVQGMGVLSTPEMDVLGNGLEITDGDNSPAVIDGTEYGITGVGLTKDQVFVITNSGIRDLSLTGTTAVVINGDPEFSVLSQPSGPIVPGGSESFTVRFIPTAEVTMTGEVFISNNDTNENPYTFTVQGTGHNLPVVNSSAVSDLDGYSVTLNGTLDDGTTADIYVYWGTTPGGTDPAQWGNTDLITSVSEGAFTYPLSGLQLDTTYHFIYYATNVVGGGWSTSDSFTTLPVVSDFKVHSGTFTMASNGPATVTLTNGYQYTLSENSTISNAFIRTVNSHNSSEGIGTTDTRD